MRTAGSPLNSKTLEYPDSYSKTSTKSCSSRPVAELFQFIFSGVAHSPLSEGPNVEEACLPQINHERDHQRHVMYGTDQKTRGDGLRGPRGQDVAPPFALPPTKIRLPALLFPEARLASVSADGWSETSTGLEPREPAATCIATPMKFAGRAALAPPVHGRSQWLVVRQVKIAGNCLQYVGGKRWGLR